MKITGGHPKKLNDPIIGHPAMKGRRWMINYAYGPHTSYKKILHSPDDQNMKEFARDNNDTSTDTRHNDVDIGYTDFYDELDPTTPQNKDDYTVDLDVTEPELTEKNDRCTRIAKRKYNKWPSAYASGAVVKCRQGKIWKGVSEEQQIDEAGFDKEKSQGLHGWFARRGGKGGKGWVDCNTCRTNPETGRKTCKACGRQAGEKRGKYPACRPTPGQCNKTGTSRKKGPSTVSWKRKINEVSQSSGIITGQNPTGKVSTKTAQITSPKINTGYSPSKEAISGSGEEDTHNRPYDFFQYKHDNAKFGNGNIIKKNGRVSLYELAKQILNNETDK